jgi:uncharacterized glyoxalase superfamily protein PhnB
MAIDANRPTIYPTLRYVDAKAAVGFLTSAFGFTEEHVTEGPDGAIVHAELSFGNGMVLLGTKAAEPSPFDTGRVVVYAVVDDPDSHHDKAVAAGADVVMALTDQPYGSREYAASDPEGNLWCFGTYQPAPAS